MANGITKDTFKTMDVDSKLNVLFDYAHDSCIDIAKLKKRPFIDKVCAFTGGLIGGAAAAVGIKLGG